MLIFKTSVEPPASESVKQGFNWDAWYAKNKSRLSEKRAKRYREDASYRAAALERSRQQRKSKKGPVTDTHTVSFNDAAKALNVTVWVLREWRRKDYFPEPTRREGRLWFSPQQVELLQRLGQFFNTHGARLSEARRPELESLVNWTYANW